MSHTPGPWQVVEGDGGYTIANPTIDQQSGAEMYDPVVWEMGGIGSEADARLIAAAPDLLAACIALTNNATDSYCEWCKRHAPKDYFGGILGPIPHLEGCARVLAEAAITKVRGE
jgi:hypothetical protein